MNNLLRTKNVPGNDKDDERNILMTSAFDLSGAIERLNKEMEQGHAEDIICAFANKQGKLVSHISRDDFARYLYNVTETLTKSDVQVNQSLCKLYSASSPILSGSIITILRWIYGVCAGIHRVLYFFFKLKSCQSSSICRKSQFEYVATRRR